MGERHVTNRAAEAAGALREQGNGLHERSVKDLVGDIAAKASLLARQEVALAKAEVKEQLRAEVKTATGLGVAAICALGALNLLLVAVVFALAEAEVMKGWVAALLVALVVAIVGAVAGLVGWRKRVREPLPATRRSVEENVRWAKERMA